MRPGARRYRPRRHVGLLRRQSPLLDRKRRRVSRRPHVLEPGDLHPHIGLHEPPLALGQPRQAWNFERRKRDDAVHGDRVAVGDSELPILEALGDARDPQRDPRLLESRRNQIGGRGAEELQGASSCVISVISTSMSLRASRSAAVRSASS